MVFFILYTCILIKHFITDKTVAILNQTFVSDNEFVINRNTTNIILIKSINEEQDKP